MDKRNAIWLISKDFFFLMPCRKQTLESLASTWQGVAVVRSGLSGLRLVSLVSFLHGGEMRLGAGHGAWDVAHLHAGHLHLDFV